ncbi:AzlD domain-containing protein [Alphaproteobacteria bacterium GH1-50]|uniref:AzlD domain-containing protein n=1 Tax=Kangsaoukella pontilimi TaxID=2691042 RepID=A0A7C9MCP8_9RHOB|nr:AzlD domain-containing protein [Kangsaoukella pontilimi]MXQ09593.1 AzlD domain-containing protein [Kangsaoukella pontilimi]
MTYSDATIWWIIVALGLGTYLIRFSFLGLIGARQLPEWLLRHLRYTPVAVLPGLVAPLVLWPAMNGGQTDPAGLAAAVATFAIAWWRKNVLLGVASGALTLTALNMVL